MQVEMVKWRDSVSAGGWHYPGDMLDWKGQVITTFGIVVREDANDIIMAQSQGAITNGSPTYCNWISIPKVCVESRAVIAEQESNYE